MKNKICRVAFLMTASSLVLTYSSYASEHSELMGKAMQSDQGMQRRVEKRQEARGIQKKGEKIKKHVKTAAKPFQAVGSAAHTAGSVSGDPHLKMAAAAYNLGLSVVQQLGQGIGDIVIGVGRYKERSQQILSNTEVLVEDVQRSTEKIAKLEKKQRELLTMDKTPVGTGITNMATRAQQSIRKSTDVLTNEKAKRGEKVKAVTTELNAERKHKNEVVKSLQVKILNETLKEIDRKINIDKTIDQLNKDVVFYAEAKNKAKGKQQSTEIEQKWARAKADHVYYMNYKVNPKETPAELQSKRQQIITKLGQLGAEMKSNVEEMKRLEEINKRSSKKSHLK